MSQCKYLYMNRYEQFKYPIHVLSSKNFHYGHVWKWTFIACYVYGYDFIYSFVVYD